jgi:hypothetical protein
MYGELYTLDVSLYFKCIKFYYYIFLLTIFRSILYMYISLCCRVSFIIINMTFHIL